MYTNNRDTYRQTFFIAWEKHLKKLPIEPIEAQLIEIILLHPEYHVFLEQPASYQAQEFSLEENPFMHMSLHLAILEQIQVDRPKGIKFIYQELIKKIGNNHDVLHQMMGCLAKILLDAQQTGEMSDEKKYLEKLQKNI